MVEIIQEGILPKDIEHTTECRVCKTKFKFKRSEAKLVYDQRDGDYYEITCPLDGCGNKVSVWAKW